MRYWRLVVLLLVPVLAFGAYHVWTYTWAKLETKDALPPPPAQETAALAEFVDTTDPNELLPDLVPLPPRDLKIQTAEDGRTLLLFSTTYYNQGRGPAELRVDDESTNVREDIEREVMQRVYFKDGGHRDKSVGRFLWHQEHLHYHFSDFIEYDLESLDTPGLEDLAGSLVKSTFCLRDISKVKLDLPDKKEEAAYDICYKRLQGVSVGWGDTYYYDYPAQNLNISDLPSGTYRLTFRANPENKLDEVRYDNNISSAVFKIDMEKKTVEVLEETPKQTPEVEHIHLDDPFGV